MKTTHKKSFPILATVILFVAGIATLAVTVPHSIFSTSLAPAISLSFLTGGQNVTSSTASSSQTDMSNLYSSMTPSIVTNKTGLLAGESVTITGTGYQPGQVVSLQITHADGTAESGGNHEVFTAVADSGGGFEASWSMGRDAAGNNFALTADGTLVTSINRIAVVQADKFDYKPGETASLTGAGYNPGEAVAVTVEHSNGLNDSPAHLPFNVTADANGTFTTTWFVDPTDALNAILRVRAVGALSRLEATTTFTDPPIILVDDNGADDYPGQKDLNEFRIDYGLPGATSIGVTWNWDDTAWSGGNTGDACSLVDTDADGKANYSFCVTVAGNPATFQAYRLYSCGDSRSDRCDQPTTPITTFQSTATASVVANSDPFGVSASPYYDPAHTSGNTCDDRPGCYTADTVANTTLKLADFGGASVAKLINVCSYPSQEPNSAPSECVITPNNGFLTIVKSATPNDGTPFPFGASINSQSGVGSWTINGSGSVQLISYAPTTSLNLSETVPSGWQLDSASCAIQTSPATATGTKSGDSVNGITIQSGLETVCTFTDSLAQASLTLNKVVVNDNGGTAAESEWTLTADGTGSNDLSGPGAAGSTDVTGNVLPGTFTLSESAGPTGYAASQYSCVKNGGAPVSGNSITLAANDVAVCTITNDDNAPSLTLHKVVTNDNGGTAAASDFTLTASGPTGFSGAGPTVSNGASFDAGTYTLSESSVPGYTASAWSCTKNGGPAVEGSSITLGLGDAGDCTITNDDNAATLIVIKHVVNDNGGSSAASDFTMSITGVTATGGNSFPGAESPGTTRTLTTVGTYNVTETGPAGYSAEYSTDCTGTIAIGETKTCTVTNDDQSATLIVKKVVINDNGGSKAANDFSFQVNGGSAVSFEADGQNDLTVDAGTYSVMEPAVTGYATTYDNCTSVVIPNGGSATCTITNNDIAPQLTLVKDVVNDNGGNAQPGDFGISVAGSTVISGATNTYMANTPLAINEVGLTGYNFVSITGDAKCPAVLGGTVTLAEGDNITCTITNNDIAPTLTLTKAVINDNGGSAGPNDFGISVGGNTVMSGVTNTYNSNVALAINEAGLTGYEFVSVAGDAKCPSVLGGTVTLDEGENVSCTITNNDKAPHLKLVKVVTNDNGGTAAPGDFTLSAAGPTSISGPGLAESDVNAGSYDLSETGLTGYTSSGWVCEGGTQSGASIALALGESATCTITNDDIAPMLTLVKYVVNDDGGNAVVADFPLFINATQVVSGQANALSANVLYTATETNLDGYTPSAWGGDCSSTGTITLAPGDNKTCTITNDDIAPTLKLVKAVVNDDGGTKLPDDWTLSAVAAAPSNGRNFNNLGGSGTFQTVFSNNGYDLSETTLAGYTAGLWSCDGGSLVGSTLTLVEGETGVTCTITNNDQTAHLKLVKVIVNDNGGTLQMSGVTLTGTGPTSLSGAPNSTGSIESDVDAGTYALSESFSATGYSSSGYYCSMNGGISYAATSITLALGDSAVCTITNDDIQPTLTLMKTVTNDNGGTLTQDDFPAFIDGSPAAWGVAIPLNAGPHTASETSQYGYTASAWAGSCVSNGGVTLSVGQNAVCTITNDDQPGTIVVVKNAQPASGIFTFLTTGTGYDGFTVTGSTSGGGNVNTQSLNAGSYTVQESTQLGWILTGIGGSSDPLTPYNCTVTGSGGSTGLGDLSTRTATISLKNGDTVTCVFENTGSGATRTQGFWATHPQLANIAWFGGSGFDHTFPGVTVAVGDTSICGRPIDTLGKLMGGFWSGVSKTSTNKKRSPLDQARMQLLQQLLAAELNASAFGSAPVSGSFATWESALCSTNQTAISLALSQAAAFNSQGDSSTFTPGTSADSKYAREVANIPFWDIIKP